MRLLQSANDAANALAIAVAGSIEDFAVLMNERRRPLDVLLLILSPQRPSCRGARFSATDLAVISKAALDNETVRKIAGTTEHTILPLTCIRATAEEFQYVLDGGEREVDGQVMTVEKYEGYSGKDRKPQQRVLYYGHRP